MKQSPQMGLFGEAPVSGKIDPNWKPDELPSLDGVDELFLDFETDGLRWWDGHRPVGAAIGYKPRGGQYQTRYLPFRHNGGNLPEAKVKEWFLREVRNKKIVNIHIKFDAHMSREWGVDLEAQGNTLTDVAHKAALLDDHRKSFSLETLGQDFLGMGKVQGLDKSRMKDYHGSEVAEYGKRDVLLPKLLLDKMQPLLEDQELLDVVALEDRVIWPTIEMEKNGAPIDRELLGRWLISSEQEYLRGLMTIHRETGVKLNPRSGESMARVFRKLGIKNIAVTENGQPSFKDEHLKTFDHPTVKLMRRLKKVANIKSKLEKIKLCVDATDGIYRYALHQLKGDEEHGGGTVTGRYSSAGYDTDDDSDGGNIQQIMDVKRQRLAFGYEEDDDSHDEEIYIMRQLFVPGRHGKLWLSADARQIEYRLFAHYANSPKILAAYEADPLTDFHALVMRMILPILKTITRKRAKDINFAKIYGAGLKKIAWMLGISLREAQVFVDAYDRAFPEVPVLLERAMKAAQDRGFVKTILGRRSRFRGGYRIHKALNSVIQGGAADINKIKLCELHEARHETGMTMFFTVHDEVDGAIQDEAAAQKVQKILDHQSLPLRVPILWDVATGTDWRRCA